MKLINMNINECVLLMIIVYTQIKFERFVGV